MWPLLADAKPAKAPDLVGPAAHGLLHTFVQFWPLWLLVVLAALAKLAWRAYQLHRLSKSGIAEIDRMGGHQFEEYLSTLFRRLGYGVELTRRRGDYGADLVITRGKHRTAVQAKRWSKRVGLKAVQEAVAAKGIYHCDQALVVANREFTQQARKLARANNVDLWDRDVLIQKLLSARGSETPTSQLELEPSTAAPAPAPIPEPQFSATSPIGLTAAAATTNGSAAAAAATCVTCGVIVSEKVRDYCLEHSQRFGGRIYCFKHQRGVRAAPATD